MKTNVAWGMIGVVGLVLIAFGVILGLYLIKSVLAQSSRHGAGWLAGPRLITSLVHKSLDLTDESSDGYQNFVSDSCENTEGDLVVDKTSSLAQNEVLVSGGNQLPGADGRLGQGRQALSS